ncbi:MAG: acetolactate decarboxylase [Desulfobacteraceae bacterium]|nr:acetolactate decarboxylase [Desulfobacteraceae bacterium]
MIRKVFFTTFVLCLSLAASVAGDTSFDVTVYGNFKRMLHTGDASGKVALLSTSRLEGIYGVGALADLRGEILVWDGKVLVTPGESDTGSTRSATSEDQATLLVTARVKEWFEVQIPHDMTQREFERFVIDSADSARIDINRPFPFIVRGEITDYTWHVITGAVKRLDGGVQHRQGHANNLSFSGSKTAGKLIGFYSAEEFEGVISHPGERFHVHYADNHFSTSGHLDSFGLGEGAVLLLPKP